MNQKHLIAIVVGALILAGGAFYGGTIYAKSGARNARGAGNGAFMARGGQGGTFTFAGAQGGRGGMMMGGFTAGKIVSKDGTGITVEMAAPGPDGASGGSKIILTSSSTKMYKTSEASDGDLAVGTDVIVTGTANADGSITAQTIQIRPEGMMLPFGSGQLRMNGGAGARPQGGNGPSGDQIEIQMIR